MTISTKEILIAADSLLSDEDRWTKGALARDCQGKECYDVVRATRWCATGAIIASTLRSTLTERMNALDALDAHVRNMTQTPLPLHVYNDLLTTTFADIKAAFARAIAAID